jgi:hypothetical protein
MIRDHAYDAFAFFSDIALTAMVLVASAMGSVLALRWIVLGYGGMLTALGWG